MRRAARTVHRVLAGLFAPALVAQVFLAGLGVFDDPTFFATHRDWGYTMLLVAVAILLVGLAAGVPRRLTARAGLIAVLIVVQSVLVGLRETAPVVSALHPVNGFIIVSLAIANARDAWGRGAGRGEAVRGADPSPEPATAV